MSYDFTVSLEKLVLAVAFRDQPVGTVTELEVDRARSFIRNAMHQHAASTVRAGGILARQFVQSVGAAFPNVDAPLETLHELLVTYGVWVAYAIPSPAFERKLRGGE